MDVKLDAERDIAARVDPVLVIQDIESFFLVGVSWMPTRKAARLDLGVILNRF